MPSAGDDRLGEWLRGRAARLAATPWLRTDTSTGRSVHFVADEVLVLDDHVATGRDVLTGRGHAATSISDSAVVPGFRRLRVDGMDVTSVVDEIRRRCGDDAAAGPNHAFMSTPYELGGPYGPPTPVSGPYTLPQGPAADATAHVAVVDTGVWRASPLPRSCYQATAADYDDTLDGDTDVGHANFITGVIMSATSNARVRIVKVLNADGVCTEAHLAAALLALPAVDVVNLSLGGYCAPDRPPALLRYALGRLLTGKDRVVVAAAGNEGRSDAPFWPAAFTDSGDDWSGQVIAVAAHDGNAICAWSNTGGWITVAAPGSDITSTYVNYGAFTSGLARWSGTSFAAPRVAAAIADRHATAGSVAAAVKEVLADAATHHYGPYPGLA
jgi:hypothetical protein